MDFSPNWHRIPFVRFLLPLICGILVSALLELKPPIYGGPILLGLVMLLWIGAIRKIDARWKAERFIAPAMLLLLFGLGAMTRDFHISLDDSQHFSRHPAEYLYCEVLEFPQEKKKSFKTSVRVHMLSSLGHRTKTRGHLLLYLQKDSLAQSLQTGDIVLLPGRYKEVIPPANPGSFDYQGFLFRKDIHHQVYLPSGGYMKVGRRSSLLRLAESCREALQSKLNHLPASDDERAVAEALLLGKKSSLDQELLQGYSAAGAMHVLAVSGLHVGIIFFLLNFLLTFLGKGRIARLIRMGLLIISLWFYAFITGLSPSVVRAATMLTAVCIAQGLQRSSSIYNTIALSAFVLLLFNPYYLMDVGFQLSYFAVLGIIYLHPKLYALIYFKAFIPDKLWEISCVSVAAQAATFPLALLYFHQFPVYFLLSNLIVVNLAVIILYLGIAYILGATIPFIGPLIAGLLTFFLGFLNQVVRWVQGLPYSQIEGLHISPALCLLIYLLIIFLLLFFVLRSFRALLIAGFLFILGLAFPIWHMWTEHRVPRLLVYDLKGPALVNWLHQGVNVLYQSGKSEPKPSDWDFHLQDYWEELGVGEPELIRQEGQSGAVKNLGRGVFLFHDLSLMHAETQWKPIEKPLDIDILILSRYAASNLLRKGLGSLRPRLILFDNTCRPEDVDIWHSNHPEIAIHSLRNDGYFEMKLSE